MNDTLLGAVDQLPPQLDPNKDYLPELVGEGKKFKTPQELARGKYESDLYIKTLTHQLDELRNDHLKLREDYTSRAKLEDLIGQLEGKAQQNLNSEQPKLKEIDKPGIDPKEIESLVSSKIQEYELTKRQQENFNSVRVKLQEQFGDNYQNVLKQQIAELGLSEEDVNALAKKSPNAFFRTLGIDTQSKTNFTNNLNSSQKPESFKAKGAQKRTRSYYLEMKKNDPKSYFSPKTNVDMHNDAVALGEAFFDVDE